MKRIKLTQGQFALVDNDDFKSLSQFKWCAFRCENTYYATRCKEKKVIYMHRQIMKPVKPLEVDHRNGNGLDNQKNNLRCVTHAQNLRNQKPRGGTSKYKGVAWDKLMNKWQAYLHKDYQKQNLGYFENEVDAAKVYDVQAAKSFGKYARLNFPK